MYVADIMTSDVVKVTEDTKVSHLGSFMEARRIRHLPVVNTEGRLSGIISHRDVQKASPSPATTLSVGEANYLLARLSAADIMHRQVRTCSPHTLVEDVACVMRDELIGCMPVVDKDRLVGIITSVDLLDFFLDITGCREPESHRLALALENRQGNLRRLLTAVDEGGGHLVSVMTPQHHEADGDNMRQVILRFRSPDTDAVVRYLQQQGYDLDRAS